mmetsp:Transcript_46504/g.141138  ORF Transcript_46504/g.141138 Transcript_46504/m.141138 type:complete len:880 (-) Transcript_46504:631-3270(-)
MPAGAVPHQPKRHARLGPRAALGPPRRDQHLAAALLAEHPWRVRRPHQVRKEHGRQRVGDQRVVPQLPARRQGHGLQQGHARVVLERGVGQAALHRDHAGIAGVRQAFAEKVHGHAGRPADRRGHYAAMHAAGDESAGLPHRRLGLQPPGRRARHPKGRHRAGEQHRAQEHGRSGEGAQGLPGRDRADGAGAGETDLPERMHLESVRQGLAGDARWRELHHVWLQGHEHEGPLPRSAEGAVDALRPRWRWRAHDVAREVRQGRPCGQPRRQRARERRALRARGALGAGRCVAADQGHQRGVHLRHVEQPAARRKPPPPRIVRPRLARQEVYPVGRHDHGPAPPGGGGPDQRRIGRPANDLVRGVGHRRHEQGLPRRGVAASLEHLRQARQGHRPAPAEGQLLRGCGQWAVSRGSEEGNHRRRQGPQQKDHRRALRVRLVGLPGLQGLSPVHGPQGLAERGREDRGQGGPRRAAEHVGGQNTHGRHQGAVRGLEVAGRRDGGHRWPAEAGLLPGVPEQALGQNGDRRAQQVLPGACRRARRRARPGCHPGEAALGDPDDEDHRGALAAEGRCEEVPRLRPRGDRLDPERPPDGLAQEAALPHQDHQQRPQPQVGHHFPQADCDRILRGAVQVARGGVDGRGQEGGPLQEAEPLLGGGPDNGHGQALRQRGAEGQVRGQFRRPLVRLHAGAGVVGRQPQGRGADRRQHPRVQGEADGRVPQGEGVLEGPERRVRGEVRRHQDRLPAPRDGVRALGQGAEVVRAEIARGRGVQASVQAGHGGPEQLATAGPVAILRPVHAVLLRAQPAAHAPPRRGGVGGVQGTEPAVQAVRRGNEQADLAGYQRAGEVRGLGEVPARGRRLVHRVAARVHQQGARGGQQAL